MINKYINDIKGQFISNRDIYFSKKNVDFIFLIGMVLLAVYLQWEVNDILVFIFILWLILNPWPSQKLAKISLLFLALTPVFLLMKRDTYAEMVSVYAFYFLILTVVKAAIEIRQERGARNE